MLLCVRPGLIGVRGAAWSDDPCSSAISLIACSRSETDWQSHAPSTSRAAIDIAVSMGGARSVGTTRRCEYSGIGEVILHALERGGEEIDAAKAIDGVAGRAFDTRGFTYKAKESATSAGKWGEEYTAIHNNMKVSIEPHLALGKGGPDTCLRIHFFKDEELGRFVVAHVGRHKTNMKT
jgi:hypothetical protein